MVEKRITHQEMILSLLSDGKPHFSAEFRDKLGILEYRKPITNLRKKGFLINSLKIKDGLFENERPAFKLIKLEN